MHHSKTTSVATVYLGVLRRTVEAITLYPIMRKDVILRTVTCISGALLLTSQFSQSFGAYRWTPSIDEVMAATTNQQSRAVLPLFPWERAVGEDRNCSVRPEGTPSKCCLGGHAGSRQKVMYDPKKCNSPGIYDRMHDYTVDYMERLPSPVDDASRNSCDLCHIIETLVQHNLTMTFQGDSLTRQAFIGLECELLRRGYQVGYTETDYAKRPKNLTAHESNRYGTMKYGEMTVSVPDTASGEEERPDHVGRILFYAIYRPFEDNIEIKEILSRSDIVVFDHGLHYRPQQADFFRDSMATMLEAFRDNGLQVFAWRETSAQHFSSKGGHHSLRGVNFTAGCAPINNEDREGFRMPIMKKEAEKKGFKVLNAFGANFSSLAPEKHQKEMVIIPFRDFTSELYYLHPGECSHYCQTPDLWLPIWRGLRLTIDRTFQHSSTTRELAD
jgi:hypothetical protein